MNLQSALWILDTDGLVLQHQGISSYSADYAPVCLRVKLVLIFFWEIVKLYLYFIAFLNPETSQVVEIDSQGRQEYALCTQWIL